MRSADTGQIALFLAFLVELRSWKSQRALLGRLTLQAELMRMICIPLLRIHLGKCRRMQDVQKCAPFRGHSEPARPT
jgi:hypothetical protein